MMAAIRDHFVLRAMARAAPTMRRPPRTNANQKLPPATQPLAGRGFGGRLRRVVAEEHTTGKSHHPTERERNRSELGLGHQRVRVCHRRDLLILRGGHFASHTRRGGGDPDLTGQADVIVGLEHEFLPFGPDGEPIVKRLDAYVTNLPVPDQLIPVKEADPNSVGEHLHLDTGSGLTPHAHDAPRLNRQFLPPLAKVGDQDFTTRSQTNQNQKGRATPVPSALMS